MKITYTSVIEPLALYAANVWSNAIKMTKIRKQLLALQRGFAQRIAKTYRTTSLEATQAIAGLLTLYIYTDNREK